MTTPQPSKDMNDKLEELLPCISCGSQADPADGFGSCTCGNEKIRQQIKVYISQTLNDCFPEKKPGFTERLDRAYDAGFNQAIEEVKRNLINKLGE